MAGAGGARRQRLDFENCLRERDAPRLMSSGVPHPSPADSSPSGTPPSRRGYCRHPARRAMNWCQGFSENRSRAPDLSASREGDARPGDDFVLMAASCWTSFGPVPPPTCFLLARCDPESRRRRTVFLLVEMTGRPGPCGADRSALSMSEGRDHEVFFDGVRHASRRPDGEVARAGKAAKRAEWEDRTVKQHDTGTAPTRPAAAPPCGGRGGEVDAAVRPSSGWRGGSTNSRHLKRMRLQKARRRRCAGDVRN